MRKLYQVIASHLDAMENCRRNSNNEWLHKHEESVQRLVRDHMPSGSGFDNGTRLNLDASKGGNKLIFDTAFHHMNDDGFYDGWTKHRVTVRPSLALGFDLAISGRDRSDIKEYIAETFQFALSLGVK